MRATHFCAWGSSVTRQDAPLQASAEATSDAQTVSSR